MCRFWLRINGRNGFYGAHSRKAKSSSWREGTWHSQEIRTLDQHCCGATACTLDQMDTWGQSDNLRIELIATSPWTSQKRCRSDAAWRTAVFTPTTHRAIRQALTSISIHFRNNGSNTDDGIQGVSFRTNLQIAEPSMTCQGETVNSTPAHNTVIILHYNGLRKLAYREVNTREGIRESFAVLLCISHSVDIRLQIFDNVHGGSGPNLADLQLMKKTRFTSSERGMYPTTTTPEAHHRHTLPSCILAFSSLEKVQCTN